MERVTDMNQPIKIGIIGDFNPNYPFHKAPLTNLWLMRGRP